MRESKCGEATKKKRENEVEKSKIK